MDRPNDWRSVDARERAGSPLLMVFQESMPGERVSLSMDLKEPEFSLFFGGILNRFFVKIRLEEFNAPRFGRRILFFLGIALFPLMALCLWQGTAWGGKVHAPLFKDPGVWARFLISLPILVVAEKMINREFQNVVAYFKSSSLVPPSNILSYDRAVKRANQWANSVAVETGILLVICISTWFGMDIDSFFGSNITHWQGIPGTPNATFAGLWFRDVSCSIYRFILFRFGWRYLIWCGFLWSVSRIKLNLAPTHPDGKGGLSVVSDSQLSFSWLALAASAQIGGLLGRSMLYDGASFASNQILIAGTIAVLVLTFVLPLCVFNGQLYACKRAGLRSYGTLAGRYTGLFERKWLTSSERTSSTDLLGSADIQSLADLEGGFAIIRRMNFFPLDLRLVAAMTLAASAPFVPLAIFSYGADEVLLRVMKLLI